MASKIFQVCFYTTVHSAITGVARRFWRCARRHLLMFAMTLVWSKMRNTGNYSEKFPTYVWKNCNYQRYAHRQTSVITQLWTQV